MMAQAEQRPHARRRQVLQRAASSIAEVALRSVSNQLAHHAPTDILIVRGSADR